MTVLALSVSANGMQAMSSKIDVISHNVANANTTGYKKDEIAFVDIGYQLMNPIGSVVSENKDVAPGGLRFGLGVAVKAVFKDYKQGPLSNSDSQYNVAIDGPGFIQVLLPDGDFGYTRDGHLHLSPDRELVDGNGFVIQPGIIIPNDALNVTITTEGKVQVQQPNQQDLNEVGTIDLVRFNVEQLEPIGSNLYKMPSSGEIVIQGQPGSEGLGMIRQFLVEDSNVNIIEELSEMIKAHRGFETISKVMESANEVLKTVATIAV